jgi:hypothetical protein
VGSRIIEGNRVKYGAIIRNPLYPAVSLTELDITEMQGMKGMDPLSGNIDKGSLTQRRLSSQRKSKIEF